MKIVSVQLIEDKVILTAIDENSDIFTDTVDAELWGRITDMVKEQRRLEKNQQQRKKRHWEQSYVDSQTESQIAARLPDFTEGVLDHLEADQIRQAFGVLTKTQRRRLEAYVFSGFALEQIAEHEGVRWQAIQKSINRAIEKIKKILLLGL